MTDTNPTRARFAENKKAFQEVLGDPFAIEPVDGQYNILRRGRNRSMECSLGEGQGTVNLARPSASDFFCDVENVIKDVITDKIQLTKFVNSYILERTDNILTQAERNRLEQRIGKVFRKRRIAPVSEYFRTIRQGPSKGKRSS